MMIANDTCAREGCGEVTPWDMPAILFDGAAFCSPDCAKAALKGLGRVPESVTLHDPQYDVDRAGLPGVSNDDVTISRSVGDIDDALSAVGEIESMYPHEFRHV